MAAQQPQQAAEQTWDHASVSEKKVDIGHDEFVDANEGERVVFTADDVSRALFAILESISGGKFAYPQL